MTEATHGDARRGPRTVRARSEREGVAREPGPRRTLEGEDSERRLGRVIAIAGPTGTLLGAGLAGALDSIGTGILVLAAGALLGTVAFFWASLRTLGGQAPLAAGFEPLFRRRIEAPEGPGERKRKSLRALKDLASEHELGKLDDADYEELSARYREEAKAVMREIDADVAPHRARAEVLASEYLATRGVRAPTLSANAATAERPHRGRAPSRGERAREDTDPLPPRRIPCSRCAKSNPRDAAFCQACGARLTPVTCPSCSTENEPDAVFCKKCGKACDPANGDTSCARKSDASTR